MRWSEVINEGAELYCPNCRDYMGKARENDENAHCSNCGEKFKNVGGIRRNKMPDVKFGRLVLTDLENEDGCVQGLLKTSKGANLGRLTQYGPKWDDYDGGRWEAFCLATKGRKKGFPDQKKAVEWIVRQTRATIKQATSENLDEAVMSFMGVQTSVPNWDDADQWGEVLVFDGPGVTANVHQQGGKFVADVDNRYDIVAATAEEMEAKLRGIGATEFAGVDQQD